MIKNELEAMERCVHELEAVKNYAVVRSERDSLSAEVAQLRQKVAQLGVQLESEITTKEQLSSQLGKNESEVKELTARLAETQGDLSSLRDFKAKLPDADGLTLAEMKHQFLHAEEKEIEKRVKEGLTVLEEDMRSRMPTLVRENLIQILNSHEWPTEVAKVIDYRARQIADGILGTKDRWPDWFKDRYLEIVTTSVGQRLDAEFEKGVRTETQEHLEVLKAGEWRKYVASKASTLTASLRNLLNELQGTWSFTCDRCDHRVSLDLGPSDLSSLLRGQSMDITCDTCLDPAPFPFILSTIGHSIATLSLEKLVQIYMGKGRA
ncbi:MAG: hypothetical protein HYX90_03205 [Chloroflexi bacterium]|nr:hypothetical protein [Chloroflexota bacterium]